MAFQVALESEPIHKVRTDPTPYRQAIGQGNADRTKVVAIVLPTDQVKKTIGTLRSVASSMNLGLRFDNVEEMADGNSKVRFQVKDKREFSDEAIAKRKATMKKNGTTAGRKATGATKKATKATGRTRKAS